MRLKPLLPSLREKKRYILFKVISEEKVNLEQIKEAFFNSILNMFGEKGLAQINAKFLENLWDDEEQIGILRISNRGKYKSIVGLGLISRIGDSRVNIKIYKVSGTIKTLKDRNKLKN